MRTELELLILVRQHIKTYFKTGLCNTIRALHADDKIDLMELNTLTSIIYNNIKMGRWGKFFKLPNYKTSNSEFFWPSGEIKPRIKYLDYLIEKYDK